MIVRIDNQGTYIRALVVNGERSTVLRRWPWPNNSGGRKKHFAEATEYAQRVSDVLVCRIEIAEREAA